MFVVTSTMKLFDRVFYSILPCTDMHQKQILNPCLVFLSQFYVFFPFQKDIKS